jgi:bacillithiol system protein YtxJ
MMSERAEQSAPFAPVADAPMLDQLFQLSHGKPVILFKHSLTCPISSAAYAEMSRLTDEVALIVVQRVRELSHEVETRTGIRHESPQAIILRNGKAVWNASHWRITFDAVERAVREHV